MRIIKGKHHGRRIIAPRNLPVRPTTDFAKEGLFNVLEHRLHLEELDVLDLFAGTGNISYEFASRGAKSVLAVDLNFNCVRFIKSTAKSLEFDQLQAVRSEAFGFINRTRGQFDLVFADPPYDMNKVKDLTDGILKAGLLREGGMLVIEHPAELAMDDHPQLVERRKYGKVNFSIFEPA